MIKRSLNKSLAVVLGISSVFGAGAFNSSVIYAMETNRINPIEKAKSDVCELEEMVSNNLQKKKIYDFSYCCKLIQTIKQILYRNNTGIFKIRNDIMTSNLENKLKLLLAKIAKINLGKTNLEIQSESTLASKYVEYSRNLYLIAYSLPTPDDTLNGLLTILENQHKLVAAHANNEHISVQSLSEELKDLEGVISNLEQKLDI